jgi:hypothetical protein
VGGFLNPDWKSVDTERKNLLLPLLEKNSQKQ